MPDVRNRITPIGIAWFSGGASHDVGSDNDPAFVPKSRDLHPAIDTTPDGQQPGKPAAAICIASACGRLGWADTNIEVIDADLGQSGAAAAHRAGFKDLLGRVTLGEVGIVLSYEVTRLARNCSDWYPLLDLCGYRQCLIGDRDGIYDPGSANGRLLLGLKGTISEVELHTLRGRLTAGLLSKAERGELALLLPAGLERDANGVVMKDSNQEVQDRIALIFSAFWELGTVGKVIRSLRDRALTHTAAKSIWRRCLARPNCKHACRDVEEPGLCRRVRLWPHPVLSHQICKW
ncbi:recombinase family protein [Mesorhizobium sp. M0659]|uniref:recombinase family protein n=1 Tax=Mesorhizobium sp. M0659 TaxID=2956980 RepID=UPI00333926E4